MTITRKQFEAAYKVAVKVYNEELRQSEGTFQLHKRNHLNQNSARDFISNYRAMRQGKVFKRTMSAPAIEYFLGKIEQDLGKEALTTSLSAVRKHITYYEGINNTRLKKMRRIVKNHENRVELSVDFLQEQEVLEQAVKSSATTSVEYRTLRLKTTNKRPKKYTAVVELYSRNADVIATILERADGKCERCLQEAPFIKKTNGRPYLEVHHRIQLAHGGDDSIENALALCPNCHRKLHYGM